ncbi:hypothetical protein SLE2022_049420 [Rubroshorea leprosula]
MARTNNNKFTPINFNHILEKNVTAAPSSSKAKLSQNPHQHPSASFSSYSSISSPKTHGRMLVLTRPTPKPLNVTPPLSPRKQQQQQTQQVQHREVPDQAPEGSASDQISLRPLGRTGSGLTVPATVPNQEREKEIGSVAGSPKPDKFVPPHLRPGFVGREERPGPEVYRGRESAQRHFGSPDRHVEDGRPKSGGHERIRRGGEADLGLMMGRPRTSGSRPSSSGWYAFFPPLHYFS